MSGAQVTLTGDAVKTPETTLSRADGSFFFERVSAGVFHLTAETKGMLKGEISGTLPAAGVYLAPAIVLGAATTTTELTVSPLTEREIATEQVHQEEKQQALGFVPNYFVTYYKHAAPLDAKQKFSLGFHELMDPTTPLFAAAVAGVEQAGGAFSGYGPGLSGYGKRFGAALADTASSTLLRDSVYPALLHQDPRYYYLGTGTILHRTGYAIGTAVVCKGDNGKWQTNYSGILGSLSAGALANLYYAPSDRHGAALTFENGLLSVAGAAIVHLVQEFVLRNYTSNVPPGTP